MVDTSGALEQSPPRCIRTGSTAIVRRANGCFARRPSTEEWEMLRAVPVYVVMYPLAIGCDRQPPPTVASYDFNGGRYYVEIEDTGGNTSLNSHFQGRRNDRDRRAVRPVVGQVQAPSSPDRKRQADGRWSRPWHVATGRPGKVQRVGRGPCEWGQAVGRTRPLVYACSPGDGERGANDMLVRMERMRSATRCCCEKISRLTEFRARSSAR